MREDAKVHEEQVRASRGRREACPFALQEGEGVICGSIGIRCGEREQFSAPMRPEDEEMKRRPHRCFRAQFLSTDVPRVMIADDEGEIRDLCVNFLEVKGAYHFIFAADGKTAQHVLDAMKRKCETLHVLISDVQMGTDEQSGFRLAEFVHHRNFPSPIILMTANAGGIGSRPKGVLKVLSKPFCFDEISKAMDLAARRI